MDTHYITYDPVTGAIRVWGTVHEDFLVLVIQNAPYISTEDAIVDPNFNENFKVDVETKTLVAIIKPTEE